MKDVSSIKLPIVTEVQSVVKSRYLNLEKPPEWDQRIDGIDVVFTTDGAELKLYSSGMQSTPRPGWKILLRSKNESNEFSWTLYGFQRDFLAS
jgi:hypothetical protein